MTSFTRYVVVLSFLRTAMGTQQTPPNMVLVGMALILTLFTMTPTLNAINEEALEPYQADDKRRGDHGGREHDHTHRHQRGGHNHVHQHKGDVEQEAQNKRELLLFIMLDGWQLLFGTLIRGFG